MVNSNIDAFSHILRIDALVGMPTIESKARIEGVAIQFSFIRFGNGT